MAAGGYTAADFDETAEVWPENWPAFEIFALLKTQWTVGFGGPTGLKYEVAFELLDRRGYRDAAWWEMLDNIRAMERSALLAMNDVEEDNEAS